eukprot:jgi/Ulvmu1/9644/UM054_0076.1
MPLRRLPSFPRLEQRGAPRADSSRQRSPVKRSKMWLLLLIPAATFLILYSRSFKSSLFASKPVSISGSMQLLSATVTPNPGDVKRVAVCFFGLTRSLNHTIDSIQQNLIGPIIKKGWEVDVFIHTYSDVRHLTNARTGEDTDLDTEQWHLLNPYDYVLTSQDEYMQSIEKQMGKCFERGTGWPHEPEAMQHSNVRNLLAQLNSVYEAGRLWEAHYADRLYKAVIFARPDVKFTCPFPATLLDNLQEDSIYAPDFALWDGINDRFALLAPAAATVWKRRRFFNLHECRNRPIHAEMFASAFANATGLTYRPIQRFGFVRVRGNGVAAELDVDYPKLCASRHGDRPARKPPGVRAAAHRG